MKVAQMQPGRLVLVPTPLDHELPLEPVALALLKKALERDPAPMILFEEIKPARRRWLSWGLPRETIEQFVLYNEHAQVSMIPEIIQAIRQGREVFLMSDGGLPAFCDPGQELVRRCRELQLPVTATPFPNSVLLALALSGFPHQQFYFAGFVPRDQGERDKAWGHYLSRRETVIVMDTAYRMGKCLSELQAKAMSLNQRPLVFLGLDLNRATETCFWGGVEEVGAKAPLEQKRDFVLVISNT